MQFFRLVPTAIAVAACAVAFVQTPQTATYKNVGRTPTVDEIRPWDIAISTDGKELPPGSGTPKEGAKLYADKCGICHGREGEGSQLGPHLVGGKGTLNSLHPVMTIGSYWPFATTVFDYINRSMPRMSEGSLSANEVYSVTAYLLYKNDIIKEFDVMDAKSLPKVQMPNRNGFIPPRLEDIGDVKKRNCRLGHCL
jgi:hypothetical protein